MLFSIGLLAAEEPIVECEVSIINISEHPIAAPACKLIKSSRTPNLKTCSACNNESILNKDYLEDQAVKKIQDLLTLGMVGVIQDTFALSASGFKTDLKSCHASDLESSIGECIPTKHKAKIIASYKSKLAEEMARMINPESDLLDDKGIFNRTGSEKKCKISEAQLLQLNNKELDKKIDGKVIEKISLLRKKTLLAAEQIKRGETPNGCDSLDSEWSCNNKIIDSSSDLKLLVRTHPVIRTLMLNNDPSIESDFNKISKKKNKEIVSWLYNKDNEKKFVTATQNHCKQLFNTISQNACKDFPFVNDSFQTFDKKVGQDLKDHSVDLFCDQIKFTNKNPVTFSKLTEGISKDSPYSNYVKNDNAGNNTEYSRDILASSGHFCSIPGTPIALNITDEIKKEFQSILGTNVQVGSRSREVLIDSGIFKTDTFVANSKTEDTPSPLVNLQKTNKIASTSAPATNTPVGSPASAPQFYAMGRGESANTTQNSKESSRTDKSTTTRDRSTVLPPSTAEFIRQMSAQNQDLLKRLVKERGVKEKYTSTEVQDQLSKMASETNSPAPTAQQAQSFDREWTEVAPKIIPLVSGASNSNRQAASIAPKTSKEAQEQKYNDQYHAALENFGKNTNPADSSNVIVTVNSNDTVKKVKIDLSGEKIEKINLSAILDKKIIGDQEGKKLKTLIDSKQNFVLDIQGKASFMVQYTDKGYVLSNPVNNGLSKDEFEKLQAELGQFLTKGDGRKHEYQVFKKELTQ